MPGDGNSAPLHALVLVPGVPVRPGTRPPGASGAPDLHRGDFEVDGATICCGSGCSWPPPWALRGARGRP